MPGSWSMTTSLVSSDLMVGALSGVVPGFFAPPPSIPHAPSEVVSTTSASARGSGDRRGIGRRRSGLVRMAALFLRLGRAVVQLRDRVASLCGVGSQALLLRLQFGDGDLPQRAL